jgi:predicted nuclease of predicted toxin-antitoxin system
MRFLADENLHLEIVRGLRQANYEVLFVPNVGLVGHKDHVKKGVSPGI